MVVACCLSDGTCKEEFTVNPPGQEGCDLHRAPMTRRRAAVGVRVCQGHWPRAGRDRRGRRALADRDCFLPAQRATLCLSAATASASPTMLRDHELHIYEVHPRLECKFRHAGSG